MSKTTPQSTSKLEPKTKTAPSKTLIALRITVGVLVGALVGAGAFVGYAYAVTPSAIAKPENAHYHLRLQVVANSKLVDFSQDNFQTPYNKDVCTADLTKQPVHFHDKLNQFVHVHWQGITGGILLKNYGWNFIGGAANKLGYRFDELGNGKLSSVAIHGNDLPERVSGEKYFIYTGTKDSYKARDWNSFLSMPIDEFMTGKRVSRSETLIEKLVEVIVPRAQAHGANHVDGDDAETVDPSIYQSGTGTETSEEELLRINEVVGNIVIFAQKTEPTAAQIQERFNNLGELPLSSCGG